LFDDFQINENAAIVIREDHIVSADLKLPNFAMRKASSVRESRRVGPDGHKPLREPGCAGATPHRKPKA
jgi:hypothetical protein